MKKIFSVITIFIATISLSAQDLELSIWKDLKMPGTCKDERDASSGKYGEANEGFQKVANPSIRFYKADTNKPAGAILICPGGGYGHLAYGKEGTQIAKLLSASGINCFVLKYRIAQNRDGALQDAQRAIRLIRANAANWNIDPNKIGIMGFSAGGHLSANTSTNWSENAYEPIDSTDKLSAKPDFTVLIYPAYIADNKTLELKPEIKVNAQTPRAFIIHTVDDKAYEGSSVGYFLALRKAGVPVDFHMFEKGGHGYGLNLKSEPAAQWGDLLKTWLKFNGFSN